MIKDEDIKDITECFVELVNGSDDLKGLMADYSHDRTLAIKIIGTQFETGFIMDGDKIRMLTKVDSPTVTATMDRNLYWNILNAATANIAEVLLMKGIYTDEVITLIPPPGIDGGAVHLMNIVKIFKLITEKVIGD